MLPTRHAGLSEAAGVQVRPCGRLILLANVRHGLAPVP